MFVSDCVCCVAGQGGPYSPEGAALGGYGLDRQAHLGLRTAGMVACRKHILKHYYYVFLHCQ